MIYFTKVQQARKQQQKSHKRAMRNQPVQCDGRPHSANASHPAVNTTTKMRHRGGMFRQSGQLSLFISGPSVPLL
jgi:hypothetical protein